MGRISLLVTCNRSSLFVVPLFKRRLPGNSYVLPPGNRWHKTSSNSNSNHNIINNSNLPPSVTAFSIGSLAGALGSLAGMGGGFVMIPLMTSVMRLSQHQAHGTSLAAVMATGLAGAASLQEHVQWESAICVAVTAMGTARLGAQLTTRLSGQALKRALGILMLCMAPAVPIKAYIMEQQQQKAGGHSKNGTPDNGADSFAATASNDSETPISARIVPPMLIGVCSGFLAGLFGVGGGTIVVPALAVFSQDCKTHYQALGTSLAAMTLPAAVGTVTHYRAGNVAWIAPALACGALSGAYLGGKVGLGMPENTLRWGFCSLLTVLGVRTILKA